MTLQGWLCRRDQAQLSVNKVMPDITNPRVHQDCPASVDIVAEPLHHGICFFSLHQSCSRNVVIHEEFLIPLNHLLRQLGCHIDDGLVVLPIVAVLEAGSDSLCAKLLDLAGGAGTVSLRTP